MPGVLHTGSSISARTSYVANRYLRDIRVTIGDDVAIQELYQRFKIRKESTGTPAEGVIDIYNLSEENETRIKERGKPIKLEAGYADSGLEHVFSGTIRRVERQRLGLDRVTRIHVGGELSVKAVSDTRARAVFIKSYEGEVTARTIASDAIQTLGLTVGSLDAIPEDAVEVDFQFSGDARIFLNEFLRPYGLHWYIENGEVKLSAYRKPADDRPVGVTVSEGTGMIGTPTITDDGVRIKTLLDPRLSLGSTVQVQSDVLGSQEGELHNSSWKVIELTHAGDNREGTFETVVEGRPLG